jgi:hypothetical protein
MPQIAVVCASKSVDQGQLALWVDAWDKQAREFCKKYTDAGFPIEYRPVVLYATPSDLPTDTSEFWLLVIMDDISAPGAEGFHDDQLGVIFARCLPENNCEAVPHEILEMLRDPTCDGYTDIGDGSGRQIADEVCDPVEGDFYLQQAQIGDQPPQDVPVTNYVLPSYFDPNGEAPFDRCEKLTAPFTMVPGEGGYQIIRDASGNTTDVFAENEKGRMAAEKKRKRPDSRVARRLAAYPPPSSFTISASPSAPTCLWSAPRSVMTTVVGTARMPPSRLANSCPCLSFARS